MRTVVIAALLAVLVLACGTKPDPYRPEYDGKLQDWSGADIQRPDGYVPDLIWTGDGPVPDNWIPGRDTIPGVDTIVEVDETSPRVMSAFSPDGKTVTVRFDEKLDAESAQAAGAFTITGSDMSQVAIDSVSVHNQFVSLTLVNPGQVNPSLVYTVLAKYVTDLAGNIVDAQHNKATIKRSVYLNILWHQHQPLYLDPIKDELSSPWVRKHATKDYYDMAAILKDYPDMHMNINFTIVLLNQLLVYYVDRLGPFVDVENNTVDEAGFLAAWKGHTDPWIDLLLEDTPSPQSATPKQLGLLYKDPWACVSTADALMKHFPQYVEVRFKNPAELTQEDFLKLKILFEVAWIDPDFLNGPVEMPNGWVVDITDLLERKKEVDGSGYPIDAYYVKEFSEAVANRLVAEEYKMMASVVDIHKELMYNPTTRKGQIEITTTPYYHPILPLIYNSDLARQGQPFDNLPEVPYSYEMDGYAQVLRAVEYYKDIFGIPPRGMWCGEGSVAEDIVHILVDAGLKWTATGADVLYASNLIGGGDHSPFYPYKVDSDKSEGTAGDSSDEMAIVFRDPDMSDAIGFKYQGYTGQDATNDFISNLMARAPKFGGEDRLITIILDGENAWESYTKEMDGKGFFHALYSTLSESYAIGEIIPLTMSEYMDGNPDRGIPAHAVSTYRELEPLFAGSWIGGNFAVWIGEGEENVAWEYLAQTRKDLELSGLPQPNPSAPEPSDTTSLDWLIWKAYDSIYGAEGSDWFWWYGNDMTTPANDDTPFDEGFRSLLNGTYSFMNQALVKQGKSPFDVPDFPPIIQKSEQAMGGPFETAPVIDGAFVPNNTEWDEDGGFFYDNDSGAMANPNDDIAQVYYGYKNQDLYIGLQFNEDLSAKLGTGYNVALYFSHKHILNPDTGDYTQNPANPTSSTGVDLDFGGNAGAAFELMIGFQGSSAVATLNKADGNGNWTASGKPVQLGGPVQGGKILELKIPFSSLDITMGDPVEVFIIAAEGSTVVDTAPLAEAKVIFEDITTLIYVTFECDVSGTLVPLDSFGTIATMPPPNGNGIVYIAGNQDALANFVPNKVALVDNGQGADEVAGDRKWSATFGFPPGTLVKYKYTIGLPTNEANWWQTEEYPLTERGLEVTQDPQYHKMIVRDVFADRPNPTGTMGPNSEVEYLP